MNRTMLKQLAKIGLSIDQWNIRADLYIWEKGTQNSAFSLWTILQWACIKIWLLPYWSVRQISRQSN